MEGWVDKQSDVLTYGWLLLWLFNDTVTQAVMAIGRMIDNKMGRLCREKRGHGLGKHIVNFNESVETTSTENTAKF
jgi:hypothetical protein